MQSGKLTGITCTATQLLPWGHFCFIHTIRHMIYMTINKRMVMACLAVISWGLMKVLLTSAVVWRCLKSCLAHFFTYTPITCMVTHNPLPPFDTLLKRPPPFNLHFLCNPYKPFFKQVTPPEGVQFNLDPCINLLGRSGKLWLLKRAVNGCVSSAGWDHVALLSWTEGSCLCSRAGDLVLEQIHKVQLTEQIPQSGWVYTNPVVTAKQS